MGGVLGQLALSWLEEMRLLNNDNQYWHFVNKLITIDSPIRGAYTNSEFLNKLDELIADFSRDGIPEGLRDELEKSDSWADNLYNETFLPVQESLEHTKLITRTKASIQMLRNNPNGLHANDISLSGSEESLYFYSYLSEADLSIYQNLYGTHSSLSQPMNTLGYPYRDCSIERYGLSLGSLTAKQEEDKLLRIKIKIKVKTLFGLVNKYNYNYNNQVDAFAPSDFLAGSYEDLSGYSSSESDNFWVKWDDSNWWLNFWSGWLLGAEVSKTFRTTVNYNPTFIPTFSSLNVQDFDVSNPTLGLNADLLTSTTHDDSEYSFDHFSHKNVDHWKYSILGWVNDTQVVRFNANGHIRDINNTSLPNIHITIRNAGGGIMGEGFSDQLGNYNIPISGYSEKIFISALNPGFTGATYEHILSPDSYNINQNFEILPYPSGLEGHYIVNTDFEAEEGNVYTFQNICEAINYGLSNATDLNQEINIHVLSDLGPSSGLILNTHTDDLTKPILIIDGNNQYIEGLEIHSYNIADIHIKNVNITNSEKGIKILIEPGIYLSNTCNITINNTTITDVVGNPGISINTVPSDSVYHVNLNIHDNYLDNIMDVLNYSHYPSTINPSEIGEYNSGLSGGVVLNLLNSGNNSLLFNDNYISDATSIVSGGLFINNINNQNNTNLDFYATISNNIFTDCTGSYTQNTPITYIDLYVAGTIYSKNSNLNLANNIIFNSFTTINSTSCQNSSAIVLDESSLNSQNNSYIYNKDFYDIYSYNDELVNITSDLFVDNPEIESLRPVFINNTYNINNSLFFGYHYQTETNLFGNICNLENVIIVETTNPQINEEEYLFEWVVDESFKPIWTDTIKSPLVDNGTKHYTSGGRFIKQDDIGALEHTAPSNQNFRYLPGGQIHWISLPYLNKNNNSWHHVFHDWHDNGLLEDYEGINMVKEIYTLGPDIENGFRPDDMDPNYNPDLPIYSQYGFKVDLSNQNGVYLDYHGFDIENSLSPEMLVNTSQGQIHTRKLYIPAVPLNQDDPGYDYNDGNPARRIYLGYYKDYPMSISHAFGPLLEDISVIQSKNWFAVRDINTNAWITGENYGGKILTLNPGEMIEVLYHGNEDAEFDWGQWTPIPPVEEPYVHDLATNFKFEEKKGYLPIIINIDLSQYSEIDKPVEVAILVDEVCKGAAVIKEDQVILNAYILTDIPEIEAGLKEISFELWLPQLKGNEKRKVDYELVNNSSQEISYSTSNPSRIGSYLQVSLSDTDTPSIPKVLALYDNYPNPFNPETTISFDLPSETNVKLEIYNIKGQKVKTLKNGLLQAGNHKLVWDGKNSNSDQVASGLYFYRLVTDKKKLTRKMILMK